jgi:signal transduction histidine kinase
VFQVAVVGVVLSVAAGQSLRARRLQRALVVRHELDERQRDLTRHLAHDARNALTAVLGLTEDLSDHPDARVAAEAIANAVVHVVATFHELGLTADLPTAAHTDVPWLLKELDPLLRAACGSDISVTIDARARYASCALEPAQLARVVMNLVLNARAAMDVGGSLMIFVREQRDVVSISVQDTGGGIESQLLASLRHPAASRPAWERRGLGLASVRRIIEGAGGSVVLASQLGLGTTVEVRLPRHTPPPPQEALRWRPSEVGAAITS